MLAPPLAAVDPPDRQTILSDETLASHGLHSQNDLRPKPGLLAFMPTDRGPRAGAWYEMCAQARGRSLEARHVRRLHGAAAGHWQVSASMSSISRRSIRSARTNRKGAITRSRPKPDDPGSLYAIGAEEGGHDAVPSRARPRSPIFAASCGRRQNRPRSGARFATHARSIIHG